MSLARVDAMLDSTTSARPLALVRMALALAALLTAVEVWVKGLHVLAPSLLAIPFVIELPRLPLALVPIFVGTWITIAILLLLGMWSRVASAMLCSACGYTLLMDQQLYSNHQYLLTLLLLLLVFSNSGACWGIDARRVGARARVAAWPVWLIKLQVSVVYGFAALSKMNAVYLSGVVIETQFIHPPAWLVPPTQLSLMFPLLAVLSIGMELFLAVALWSARWRYGALLVGIGLHGFIVVAGASTPFAALEFTNFALISLAPYILFFWPLSAKSPLRCPISSIKKG